MFGDSGRVAKARQLISDHARRLRVLPPGLVNDQPLIMLLYLFAASFENEPLTRQQLVAAARSSPAAAERWARYLTASGLIQESDEATEVMLTATGSALLRELLDGEPSTNASD